MDDNRVFKSPVQVPFESIHTQTFPEGYKTEVTFNREQMAKVGDEIKLLNYTLHCVFTPEKRHPGRKPNEPAMMSVHVHALVTDLAGTNSKKKVDRMVKLSGESPDVGA